MRENPAAVSELMACPLEILSHANAFSFHMYTHCRV